LASKNNKYVTLSILLIISSLITACASPNKEIAQSESAPELDQIEEITTENTSIPGEVATPEPTAIPFTPTPDLRTPPDQWQNWPIVPEVTNRAREIYASGSEKGVNQNAFSKVGDCQNVSDAFLGFYDNPNRYSLNTIKPDWQETIDHFTGYFDRDGYSFGQGLNVAAALSPLQADPDICSPSEGPLQCELRVVNPSFAFVSFERWWSKETPPEVYEQYLRTIIEIVIDNGTVPILITKADNVEGGHQINQIIANLAFEFDIPLYNWWKAAQSLSNKGIDPERNDGFHISIDAWSTRSYFGLETLDTLWKGLEQSYE